MSNNVGDIDFSQSLSGFQVDRRKLTGATSAREQAFCEWFGENAYRGVGEIVELGPWLGSLTIPLVKGLSRNSSVADKSSRVHVYDRFVWDELMENWVAGTQYVGRIVPEGDFRFLYEDILQEYRSFLVVNKSDLSTQQWDGKPIEFLLNDATKNLEVLANVVRQFFKDLIPQFSHVAHQDYLWFAEAYTPICMYRLRDCFTPAYSVPDSCMVLFKNTTAIPRRVLDFQLDYESLTPAEIADACDWNLSILDENSHILIRAGSAWMLFKCGLLTDSRSIFEEIERDSKCLSIRYQFQRKVLQSFGLEKLLDLPSIPWFFSDRGSLPETIPDTARAIRYWDWELGWLWTAAESYPIFHSDELEADLEYQLGSINPRIFRNIDDGSVIRV